MSSFIHSSDRYDYHTGTRMECEEKETPTQLPLSTICQGTLHAIICFRFFNSLAITPIRLSITGK